MRLGLKSGLTQVGATGAASFDSFTYDSDTFFWDGRSNTDTFTDNTIDTVGADAVGKMPDQLGSAVSLSEDNRDYQPLVVTDGLNFGGSSNRTLTADSIAPLDSDATYFYMIANVRFDAINGGVIFVNCGEDIWIYLTNSRKFGLKINGAWKTYSNSITLSSWQTFEYLIDTVTNDVTFWLDGVETALQYDNVGTLSSFGAVTDIAVGTSGGSIDGALQMLGMRMATTDDSDIRSSMQSYFTTELPS